MTKSSRYKLELQRGTGLIEVLVAILVLAVGMLAMSKMHGILIRDGGTANNRAIAVSLAQEKLDDLRGFKWINAASSGGEGCGNGIFCYSEIATNAGGFEYSVATTPPCSTAQAAGNLRLSSGLVEIKDLTPPANPSCKVLFTANRTWTVVDNVGFKLVTVTVTWTDQNGNGSEVLQSAIVADDANITAFGAGGAGAALPGPKVAYTAGQAPDAVAISIGGGKSTETSKPLPEVFSNGNSISVTLPQVVYQGDTSKTLVSQEEFSTVSCSCSLLAKEVRGSTPYRSIWNSTTGALEIEKGVDNISKPVGYPSDINNASFRWDPTKTIQSPLCTACCRDHHDTADEATFRPYAELSEFSVSSDLSGDHKHYLNNGSGAAASVGQDYAESCRMKRIDGYWRVVPDWYLIGLTTIPCDYFSPGSAGCPPASADAGRLTTYKDALRTLLSNFVYYIGINQAIDTSTAKMPEFTGTFGPLVGTGDSDALMLTIGGSRQLIARGIYADVIFKPRGTAPRTVDATYYGKISGLATGITSTNENLLSYLQFYDTNLTMLARWTPTSVSDAGNNPSGSCTANTPDSDPVCVTNQPIKVITSGSAGYYDNFYTRGKLIGKLSGSNLVTATVPSGNVGLTNGISIDTSSSSTRQASVLAKIGGTGGINGTVARANETVDLSKISISATNGVVCVKDNAASLTSSSTSLAYSCTIPSSWSGPSTLTFTSSTNTTNPITFGLVGAATRLYPGTITFSSAGQQALFVAYGSVVTIGGQIKETHTGNGANADASKVTVFATGGTCTRKKSGSVYTYSCTVPSNTNVTLSATTTESGASLSFAHATTYTSILSDDLSQDITATVAH